MQDVLKFLSELKKHNDKPWFDANKERYLTAKAEVEDLVTDLIARTTKFDPQLSGIEAKNCVFRIYKDVRFSKDKTPYKTNMGASINPGGRKSMTAGYYIHIEPGACFLAGGCYMPSPEVLAAVRQEIDYNGADFRKIINNKDFKAYFGGLEQEDKVKTAPKGYDKEHPDIELLKLKSFVVAHDFSDQQLLAADFPAYATKVFKAILPLNTFLRGAQ